MIKITGWMLCFFQTVLLAAGGPTFKLVTPSEELAQGETVGVKFSSRMDETPSDEPPILVEPKVPYEFQWTSPSTGSIRFLSGLDLGVKLRFDPRPGLKDSGGQPIQPPPEIERERKTPSFGVLQSRVNGRRGSSDSPSAMVLDANASVRVTFNDDVKPDELRAAAWFVSDDGVRIAAGAVERAPRHSFQERLLTWKEKASKEPPAAVLVFMDGSNDWVVAPQRSLDEGKHWSFELDLKRARGGALAESDSLQHIAMGNVVSLKVESALLSKKPLEKTRLTLNCSKPIWDEEIKRLSSAQSLVTPPVDELKVYRNWKGIVLVGDFQPGVDYRVRLEKGLRAEDGSTLKQPFEATLQLDPLPPRLYFDRELARQLSSGRRHVALMGVKVPKARITAHLIPPGKGWDALQLWKQYQAEFHSEDGDYDREGVRVDPAVFEGRVVHESIVDLDYATNQESQVLLNWDDILGKNKSGVVLLTAEEIPVAGQTSSGGGMKRGVQTLVQLTNIGLELFAGRGGPGFCFAYSLADAAPLARLKCVFYNAKREQVGQLETGEDGTASVPFQGVAWVEATLGNDQLTVLFDTNFWVNNEREVDLAKLIAENEPRPQLEGFVFSDRDLYRPGETLHAKVFIREVCAGGLQIPRGMKFQAVLKGDRGEQLYDELVELNSAGAWTFSKELPRRTGGYTLSLAHQDSIFHISHAVTVAEFQPDAFRISLTAPFGIQSPANFDVGLSATYLSGQPANDAVVRWEMHESPASFTAPAYGDVEFGVHVQPNVRLALWPNSPRDVRSGELKLDAAGKADFSWSIDASPNPAGPRDMVFQTEVTDLNNQTLSKSHEFVAHSSDFYLGIYIPKKWVKEGGSVPVQLVAVHAETREPIEPKAPMEIVVRRVLWSTSVTRTASGEVKKTSATLQPVRKLAARPLVPTLIAGQWVLPGNEFSAELLGLQAGQYVVEAQTTDSRGRPVLSMMEFDVAKAQSPKETFPDFERDSLSVAPDKKLYHPGETAHILVRSNVDGLALATFQQQSVKRYWLVPITKEKPYFDMPILPADAPGGVLEVHLLRGALQSKLKNPMPTVEADDVEIRVEPADARLKVGITGVPADTRPGSVINPVVHVLQADGKPAVGADVALYAVHEGVLQMTGYVTPQPVESIFPMSFRRLRWRSSIWALRDEDQEPDYQNKGYLVGSDGKGGSGSDLRGNFKLNALWIGSALTGPDGSFSAPLEVPDNLAKFRVMAVASHGPQSFGSAQAGFRVNKPLQIQPGVPQFANRGDFLRLRCMVQNTQDVPLEVDVSLDVDPIIRLEAGSTRRTNVPARTSVALEFPAMFVGIGTAEFRWRARAVDGSEADGARESMNVGWHIPALHETRVQRLGKGLHRPLDETDPVLLAGTGQATVTIHRSPLADFQKAANGLLAYPYGCAEQTVSTLFPWVLAAELNFPRLDLQKRMTVIEEGITRIFAMQMPDGSIGYWPRNRLTSVLNSTFNGGQPSTGHPWCSAYAGLLIALIEKDADPRIATLVPAESAGRLREYLKTWLTKPSSAELAASYSGQALAAYALALAGKPETAAHERLFDSAQLLGVDDRALLAMAIHLSGGLEKSVRALLDSSARVSGLDYFSSPARDTAMALLAAVQTGAAASQVDTLFAESKVQGTQGAWRTTQDNAWSLYAASRYVKSLPPLQARVDASWSKAAVKRDFSLSEKRPFEEALLTWNGAGGRADFQIENPSEAALYAVTSVTSYPDREQPPQQSGYILSRKFEKMDANQMASPVTDLRIGDRVRVIIELTALQNGKYLAVDCPLPALLEPIQQFQKNKGAPADADERFGDHTEIRADRVLFFKDDVRAGSYRITLMTRVRAAGEAVAPAARAEEMYRPERFAQTASEKLIVR